MVKDPLKRSHGAFDKAVKGAKGDVQKLKDAIKLYPKKVKRKVNSVNSQYNSGAPNRIVLAYMYTTQTELMITTEYGKQNNFPTETPPRLMTNHNHSNDQWHEAEELNGRLAMLGFSAALGAYIFTGQIIPGIF